MQTTALQMRLRYPGEDDAQLFDSSKVARLRPALSPVPKLSGTNPHIQNSRGGTHAATGGATARPITGERRKMSRKKKGSDDVTADEGFVRCYYVRVTLVGMGGTERRGTVEVDGLLLRALADNEGSARAARSWVRDLVTRMCRQHPQDLGLGSARWKTTTGLSLKAYVEQAIRRRTSWARGAALSMHDENASDAVVVGAGDEVAA